jgi:hypothetical protein
MDFLYGMVGFIGFESLRIYKLLCAGLPITPHNRKRLYGMTLVCVAVFSGVVAHAFAQGNIIEAIYVGFSVPTGLKTLLENPRRRHQKIVDDIEIQKPTGASRLLHWADDYFGFK